MIITCLFANLLLQGSQAFAPQQRTVDTWKPTSSALSEHREDGGWLGPATAAAVASLALVSQMAFASPLPLETQQPGVSMHSTSDSPSLLLAAFGGIETMDLSMPSYSDANKGDVLGPGKDIPSFNPFDSETKEEASTSAIPAEGLKAAIEAKRAEEKAATEAKKTEEEAKKAEKEARRLTQLEKQKEAAERAKQKEKEAAATKEEPSILAAPEISLPSFSTPSFSPPEMPEVKVLEMPKFSMPKMDLPEKSDMPKFDAPKFEAPKVLEFRAPKMSIPSFDAPKSSGGYDFSSQAASASKEAEVVEPQEVRDARAKEARSDFLAADNEAKELERQARELREVANGKKKIANELKGDACKTRLGGKIVCLRPLNSGY